MFKLNSINTDGIEGGGYQSDQIDRRLLNFFFLNIISFPAKLL
jgi:hypothetical protein